MNIIQRFKAKTPHRNKIIGRYLTAISGALVSVETVLQVYSVPVPNFLHKSIIVLAIITTLLSAYHGQKVKK